ncbi:DUF1727 domain-containing protein [Candidatus Gottesmanbacteria bacterium]|nr:DUF1727 domain-containing protein [Candidatus Gottesmanbacteria bacterium]
MIKLLAKIISVFSKTFNLGAGGTWPGEVALKLDPKILEKIAPKNVILVAGTNGKTTTTLMIKHLLGDKVVTNASGANLLNGVVSAILTSPPDDWGVFEVDENTLPVVIKSIKSIKCIVLLNLFRDQLDRYGEVDAIAKKWALALKTKLVLNADDPQIASLGNKNSLYFGLEDTKLFQKTPEHAMDSQFCPKCGARLKYAGHFYSHLGHWNCPNCGQKRPKPQITSSKYPLVGTYNMYNALAATAVAKILKIPPNLSGFHPAFGRQEEIHGTKILLSKNPAGFNESLRWDVDFEMLKNYKFPIYVSGNRQLDLALRLKYAEVKFVLGENLNVFWILATYSAMLEIRKKLTGRKIL